MLIILLATVALIGCHTTKEMDNSTDIFNFDKQKELLTEKYWKLTKLYGQDVNMTEDQEREIFFRLTSAGRLTGFGGCNPISGAYELQKGLRISFDKVATGLKFCAGDIPEAKFLEVLNTADNYSFSEDNQTLSLNKARMAPLAVFESVVSD